MATQYSCVFGCIIGTSCNIVLSDIRLGVGWLRLGIVLVDGDWAVPQQRHHKYFISLVLADTCRPGVGIDHRWYRLLLDLIFFIKLWH